MTIVIRHDRSFDGALFGIGDEDEPIFDLDDEILDDLARQAVIDQRQERFEPPDAVIESSTLALMRCDLVLARHGQVIARLCDENAKWRLPRDVIPDGAAFPRNGEAAAGTAGRHAIRPQGYRPAEITLC